MTMSPLDHLVGVGHSGSIGASASDSGAFDVNAFFMDPKELGKGRRKREKRLGLRRWYRHIRDQMGYR